jgi:hypothetical protein
MLIKLGLVLYGVVFLENRDEVIEGKADGLNAGEQAVNDAMMICFVVVEVLAGIVDVVFQRVEKPVCFLAGGNEFV